MTIEEVQTARQGLENEILEMVRTFERSTRVSVSHIDLNRISMVSGQTELIDIHVGIQLDRY